MYAFLPHFIAKLNLTSFERTRHAQMRLRLVAVGTEVELAKVPVAGIEQAQNLG